jgi:hypothetical protein
MKKHAMRTLRLKTETVRSLIEGDLSAVAGGGGDTALCPNTRGCPFPVLTDTCACTGKGC